MKKNTLDLIVHLMKVHNVPFSNVLRHYDASRKICPKSMSANNWKEWGEFKATLYEMLNPKELEGMVKIEYKGKTMLIPGLLQDGKNYVAVRDLLESMGYSVGWDTDKKVVLVK
jgi:DNA replication protein DnaD